MTSRFRTSQPPPLRPLFVALITALAALLPTALNGAESQLHRAALSALEGGEFERALEIVDQIESSDPGDAMTPRLRVAVLQRRGEAKFFAGKIEQSIADFDLVQAIDPERKPYHWQRGIALYYADRFKEGLEQFEMHQSVNSQDVENAVWHSLCAARVKGGSLDQARKNFIEISRDSRVPMAEIHALFKGTGTEQEVLDAAAAARNDPKNSLCYAHLYLGLYYEALGKAELSLDHIRMAVVDYPQAHYMGKVARVHLKLRSTP
ncbi:MAG: hypothetical protein ACC661_08110 [Verrucomicrobiales bacterium]